MINRNSTFRLLGYLALAILVAIPLFVHLDHLCLRIWDEARNAVSALEMAQSGNLIIATFNGEPDHWNLKPPLLIWFQALGIKLLGPTELAVRLPSAIAALTLCIWLMWFSKRYFRSFWFGAIACLILVTSQGFTGHHTSRTGDYDTLLTLFLTVANLFFFLYLQKKRKGQLLAVFLMMALAVLTKSIAALLFAPSLAVYTLIQGRLFKLLRSKQFWVGGLCFITVSFGYFFLREILDPGYLKAVWNLDIGGRYVNVENAKDTGFWFYFRDIYERGFQIWTTFLPVSILVGLIFGDAKTKRLMLFSLIMVLGHLLIISSADSKLHWYTQPEFPFLAIMVSLGFYTVIEQIRKSDRISPMILHSLLVVVMISLFYTPYRWTLKRTVNPKEHAFDLQYYALTYHLRSAVRSEHDLNGYLVVNHFYQSHNDFYMAVLKQKGVDIDYVLVSELSPGDKVLVNDDQVKTEVTNQFKVDSRNLSNGLVEYEIQEKL